MVGRLMRDKGVYEFLEAAQRVGLDFPDARFSILGRAETFNPTGISAGDIADLQRRYPVSFLEETTDVRPYLAQSSVFVLPSFYREGLPRTILEAMATGRAVITTDMPGCRDPIENGKNGIIVPPRDVDALADAMRAFLTNPALAAEMGKESRIRAENIYDVARVNLLLIGHMGIDQSTQPAISKNAPERAASQLAMADPR